jgi:hypothetical protein
MFNLPLQLSAENKADPQRVFADFFGDYNLSECREWIWNVVETCLTSSNPSFADPDKRGDLLLFRKRMEAVLEAAFILAKREYVNPGEGESENNVH